MHKVIYCECGWAGTPQQLEQDETVNNVTTSVCPRCGNSILPPPVEVDEKKFRLIMDQQRQEAEDYPEAQEEEEEN